MPAFVDLPLTLRSDITFTGSTVYLDLNNDVLGMTLNCVHIFIVTVRLLYWCVMRPASQRFFIRSCIYVRILIISYLATFLGTNSLYDLYVLIMMCRKAINQSINLNNVWVAVATQRHYQAFLDLRLVYTLQKIFLQLQDRLTHSISYIWKKSNVRKLLNYMKQWRLKRS